MSTSFLMRNLITERYVPFHNEPPFLRCQAQPSRKPDQPNFHSVKEPMGSEGEDAASDRAWIHCLDEREFEESASHAVIPAVGLILVGQQSP
jgi:hypothetical protein